jgi:excisionase family DNA binding protein
MNNKFEHEYLTQKECSEYLGVGHNTIYNWISQGRIVVHKLGRSNRFKKSDLDKMFQLKK